MLNGLTHQPIKLQTSPNGLATANVLLTQAAAIKSLLESNQIRFWISESNLFIEGKPRTARIFISQNSDYRLAQQVLDSVP